MEPILEPMILRMPAKAGLQASDLQRCMITKVGVLQRHSSLPHLWQTSKRLAQILAKGAVRAPDDSLRQQFQRVDLRLSPEVRAQLFADYERGIETSELQAIYRLSKSSVRKLLIEAGAVLHRKPATDEQRAECIRLYGEGLTIREVAAALDVPKTTVQDLLRRAGVAMRPAARR